MILVNLSRLFNNSILMSIKDKIKYNPVSNLWNYHTHMAPLFTSLPEAVAEIKRRKTDPVITAKISKFLKGDIPAHFNGTKPVFYLSRHLGSPNFETLKVYDMTKEYDFPLVIGEDIKGFFVSSNPIKVPLAKLPILKGNDKNGEEIIEKLTVIDFNKNQGKRFCDIRTKWNQSMVDFHRELSANSDISHIEIVNESAWIDKHYRGTLYKQYVHVLTLMCAHGILMEAFFIDEIDFVKKIVKPAFMEVEKNIGVRPLIVEHINHKEELERMWDAYPESLSSIIKSKLSST